MGQSQNITNHPTPSSSPGTRATAHLSNPSKDFSVQRLLNDPNLKWQSLGHIVSSDTNLCNFQIANARVNGKDVVIFRYQDKRLPKDQYVGGIVEKVNDTPVTGGFKGRYDGDWYQPWQAAWIISAGKSGEVKLQGAETKITVLNRLNEKSYSTNENLGLTYSRWEYALLGAKPGVNIDRVHDYKSDCFAKEIGLRQGDVIVGFYYHNSKGEPGGMWGIESKADLEALLRAMKLFPQEFAYVRFLVKPPDLGVEDVTYDYPANADRCASHWFKYDPKREEFVKTSPPPEN